MEMGATEPTPDLEDVLQEAPPTLPMMAAVPVAVEGMVTAHELPARRLVLQVDTCPVGTWTSLVPESPKRKSITLLSADKPFYLSVKGTGGGAGSFMWPAGVPLTLASSSALTAMSADAALPATISHVSALWAD